MQKCVHSHIAFILHSSQFVFFHLQVVLSAWPTPLGLHLCQSQELNTNSTTWSIKLCNNSYPNNTTVVFNRKSIAFAQSLIKRLHYFQVKYNLSISITDRFAHSLLLYVRPLPCILVRNCDSFVTAPTLNRFRFGKVGQGGPVQPGNQPGNQPGIQPEQAAFLGNDL